MNGLLCMCICSGHYDTHTCKPRIIVMLLVLTVHESALADHACRIALFPHRAWHVGISLYTYCVHARTLARGHQSRLPSMQLKPRLTIYLSAYQRTCIQWYELDAWFLRNNKENKIKFVMKQRRNRSCMAGLGGGKGVKLLAAKNDSVGLLCWNISRPVS